MDLVKQIDTERERRQITIREHANRLGWDEGLTRKKLRGERPVTSFELVELAAAIGMDMRLVKKRRPLVRTVQHCSDRPRPAVTCRCG